MNTETDTRPAEDALVALLSRIAIEDRKPPGPHAFRRYSVTEVMETDDIIRQPVRHACARAIREIGLDLHRAGADMDAVAKRVWSRAPSRKAQGHWVDVIDKRWSGIGNWWS